MIKLIRSILMKNTFLYSLFRLLYININPFIIRRRILAYKMNSFIDCKFSGLKNVKFVQVGSNDGVSNDPLRQYIVSNNEWKGVLIEPVPYIYENLKKLYSDNLGVTVLNCAISDDISENLTFYYVDKNAKILGEGLPDWYQQLGSFHRENIIKHMNGLLEPFIISASVQIRSLDSIFEEFGAFQVLHIDAEGHDLQVLKSLNFSKWQPNIIIMEYKHLYNMQRKDMLNIFNRLFYQFRFFLDDVVAYKGL
jgi:FkbM family methyltransferase